MVSAVFRIEVVKAAAVEQAKTKLAKAERSLQSLKEASGFEMAEDAWTDFLLAVSGIYSKLEQGSKGEGKSEAWFGKKKYDRKKDQLLRYLHFARNADEHGIERIVIRDQGSSFLRRKMKFGERVPVRISPVDPSTGLLGPSDEAFVPGPALGLIRVHDRRFGDSCDPPTEHLGNTIEHRFPYDTAINAMPYLRTLISEAEGLV